MRTAANRFKVKRLFILGAGASYSATKRKRPAPAQEAPLDTSFSARILDLDLKRPLWVAKARDAVEKGWLHHQPLRDLGLEEAVIRQFAHNEFIDAIHPRRRARSGDTEATWITHLAHLMCFVLGRVSEHGNIYRTFAGKVFPTSTPVADYKDRIITFNYDCLLDDHLLGRLSAARLYFDTILLRDEAPPRRAERYPEPLMLKLHGSANWRCNIVEFAQVLSDSGHVDEEPHYIDRIWRSDRTPAPDDDDFPLIIPPLPKKPVTRISIFRYLWMRAYEYLHEAEELVIAGYSLPPTDQLAQSLFGNFSNSALREITIIDPNPAIISRWQQLLRRSNVHNARWTYYDDFADYVKRM